MMITGLSVGWNRAPVFQRSRTAVGFDRTHSAPACVGLRVAAPVTRPSDIGPWTYYYGPSSFAAVTTQTFGTSRRNIVRNHGLWNTDLDIAREFPIKDWLKLQFRAESFNSPNTSHFGGIASGSVTSGSFIQILSASRERQCCFGLRLQW